MIKKRLVELLAHAKKYIVYQVIWQWLSLLCQILLIFCGATLLAEGLSAGVTVRMAAGNGSLILLAILLRVCFERQASRASCRASRDVKRILRNAIYTKLLKLGASYRELAGDHTVILISHRLASVVDAHRIYLLGEGRIAEQGTHKELMELGGSYAELYRSQQELEQYGKEGNV